MDLGDNPAAAVSSGKLVKVFDRGLLGLFGWRWRLEFHGSVHRHVIAEGTAIRRVNADRAAASWERVWLRRHGMY